MAPKWLFFITAGHWRSKVRVKNSMSYLCFCCYVLLPWLLLEFVHGFWWNFQKILLPESQYACTRGYPEVSHLSSSTPIHVRYYYLFAASGFDTRRFCLHGGFATCKFHNLEVSQPFCFPYRFLHLIMKVSS